MYLDKKLNIFLKIKYFRKSSLENILKTVIKKKVVFKLCLFWRKKLFTFNKLIWGNNVLTDIKVKVFYVYKYSNTTVQFCTVFIIRDNLRGMQLQRLSTRWLKTLKKSRGRKKNIHPFSVALVHIRFIYMTCNSVAINNATCLLLIWVWDILQFSLPSDEQAP